MSLQSRSSADWLREAREVVAQTLQYLKAQPDAYLRDEWVRTVVELSRQIVDVAERED